MKKKPIISQHTVAKRVNAVIHFHFNVLCLYCVSTEYWRTSPVSGFGVALFLNKRINMPL